MTSWDLIFAWCENNAPATRAAVFAPQKRPALDSAERRTGGWPWPDDIIEFFELCDGTERSPAGYLFPGFRPLTLSEVVRWWEEMLKQAVVNLWDQKLPAFESAEQEEIYLANLSGKAPPGPRNLNADKAGTAAGQFIAPWLPIAEDQSGNFLVADRRRGAMRGCLAEIDSVDADARGYAWRNLAILSDLTAEAMQTDDVVRGSRLKPVSRAGRLSWEK